MSYLPLTKGQQWWLTEMPALQYPGWYNIEFMVRTKQAMDESAIRGAVDYLLQKYESLCVRMVQISGEWRQEVYPASEAKAFVSHDLVGVNALARDAAVRGICIAERDGLLPLRGNLIRVVWFKFGPSEGRLWFCMHHIVSDFVSVLIVSGEFMAAYNALIKGKGLAAGPSREYRKWLYLMDGYRRDVLLPAELSYWLSLPWSAAQTLPTDFPERFSEDGMLFDAIASRELVPTYQVFDASVEKDITSLLYGRWGNEFEDMLLAAFFLAVAGSASLDCLDLTVCNAGRQILPAEYGINANALLGWLSTTRALLLHRPSFGDLASDLEDVIAQIRAVPNGGIGFEQIGGHIVDEELRERFFGLRHKAPIFFNYLGRVSTEFSNELYETVYEDTGRGLRGWEVRNNLLACDIGIAQGRLFMRISSSLAYVKEETLTGMLDSMKELFGVLAGAGMLAGTGQQITEKMA